MNKSYLLFYVGVICGLFLSKLSSSEHSIPILIGVSIYLILLSIDNVRKVFSFITILSILIYIPTLWVVNGMEWWEVFVFIYLLIGLFNYTFDKPINEPITFTVGDITKLPYQVNN